MPILYVITAGVANGNSIAEPVQFPSIERQAVVITSIQALRGGGRLLTDGDQAIVALSHRTDILTADLADDQDDFLDPDNERDYWWIHGLSDLDHDTDHLAEPERVAGPQTLVFFNGTGATTAARLNITYHLERMELQDWTLLKTRSSYEGSL